MCREVHGIHLGTVCGGHQPGKYFAEIGDFLPHSECVPVTSAARLAYFIIDPHVSRTYALSIRIS